MFYSESSSEVLTEDIPGQDRTEISRAVRVKKPCIIVFDSLAVEARGRVYSTLREYLRMEYKVNTMFSSQGKENISYYVYSIFVHD